MKRKRAAKFNKTGYDDEDEFDEPETSMRSRQVDLGREKSVNNGRMDNYPNALGQMIASIIKEISKETGGLANLSRSFVDNSISNGPKVQPHVNMDHVEEESRPRRNQYQNQNSEYKEVELMSALSVIKKTMELDAADSFNRPVDPIALDLPDYFDVIKTPIDFGTICHNLENGLKYMNSADVFRDVQHIWNNCSKYNKKGDHILGLMKRVKTFFTKYWKAAGLHTEQSLDIGGSSMLRQNKRQKENPVAPVAKNFARLREEEEQEQAGFNHVAENQPWPINMQAGQPQQNSSPSQSSPEKDEDFIYTPKKHQARRPTRANKLLPIFGRMKIVTNEHGQPVGPEAAKLSSFLGHVARDGNLAPLSYLGWSKMPEENKENMWQKVLTRFDIDPSCRSWVLMSLESKWRNFKSILKTTRYDTHMTDEERLADRDLRVSPDQWSVLISHWSSEKFQTISAINKANRAKVKFNHTSGTKSFARLLEEEREKRPDGREPSQAELFIMTRTRKDGQPVNEPTDAVISQLRETGGEEEIYNRVIGEDRKGGVSLSGLKATPRAKNPTRAEALSMVKENKAEVVEMKERLVSVEQTCSQMASQMSAMMAMMATMQKSFIGENYPNAVVASPVPGGRPNQSGPACTFTPEVSARQTRGMKRR